MATRNYTKDAITRTFQADMETPLVRVISHQLNTAQNAQAAADVAEMLQVRAEQLVLAVVLEVITAEGGTLTIDVGDGVDVDGWLDGVNGNAVATYRGGEILQGAGVIDPGNLIDAAGSTHTIAVTGAALGDKAEVVAPYDLQGILLSAYVSVAGTVAFRLQNETGGAIDLASGSWMACVTRATERYASKGRLYLADDTIDVLFNNAAALVNIRLSALVADMPGVT